MSPWWWTEIASNWGAMDSTILLTFWVTGAVFIAVLLFTAYCVYKFRHKEGQRALYEPENKKLEWWLTIITAVGVVVMLAPGLVVWNDFVTVPEDAVEVEVFSQQWQWSFRYPGKDGKLGTTNVRLISDDNPFGMNPDDPNGQDDILVAGDDLHIELDQPIKFLLRSIDVLHNFHVPQFRAKMDIVPGMVTFYWITPIRTGTFDILCFELCGVGHHDMRAEVVVENKAAYDKWLGEQETFAQSLARGGDGTTTTLAERDISTQPAASAQVR
jgi:cytochrome c oxidase subunit 2